MRTMNGTWGLVAATVLGTLGAGCGEGSPTGARAEPPGRKITFNGRALTREALAAWEALEVRGSFRLPDGSYWYDAATGAAGHWGGPASAFLPAGLQVAGPMPPGCSGGGTLVFVNGRELHPQDVEGLQRLVGAVPPARYWMDSMGNFGHEGGPLLGNVIQLAQRSSGRGGGTFSHYFNDGAGTRISIAGTGDGSSYYSDSKGNSWWPGK